MFLPKLIEKQLLICSRSYTLPEIKSQLYNPISVGKASKITLSYPSETVSALYCKLGDFSSLTYSEPDARAAYPIVSIVGGNFCNVSVSNLVEFGVDNVDAQTRVHETLVDMEDFPTMGIIGDSFELVMDIRKRYPFLRLTAYPKTGDLKFYMNSKLEATLPAGLRLTYLPISRSETFGRELRAAIRRTLRVFEQEEIKVERVPA